MATANGYKAMRSVPTALFHMMTDQKPSTAITETIGVVLAGGKSSRMGRDKATLELAGEPLLHRARNVLLAAGCSRVLLSGLPRPNWSDEAVPDLAPDSGPVGGIISALQSASTTATEPLVLLFIPVDTPLLSPELLQDLTHEAYDKDGCAIADAPLPLALRTTANVLEQCDATLQELIKGESVSVRCFLNPLTLVHIPQSDAIKPLLINVNTPNEWESLNRELENCT